LTTELVILHTWEVIELILQYTKDISKDLCIVSISTTKQHPQDLLMDLPLAMQTVIITAQKQIPSVLPTGNSISMQMDPIVVLLAQLDVFVMKNVM
jgi:hypothetical protein